MSVVKKTLIFIPTYNERDNVGWLWSGIAALNLPVDILFVDDNSPDGTGKILDEMAKLHPQLHVLHRTEKSGIGSAHQAGIAWAYENGYQRLITMDSDLTHSPTDIPLFLEKAAQADVVVGSRYMMANSLEGWNWMRRLLTRIANILTHVLLGINEDATGAFRLYDLERVPRELFRLVRSQSYSFFFESLYFIKKNGFRVVEVPIVLPPRTYGSSKMSYLDIYRSIKMLVVLFVRGQCLRIGAGVYDHSKQTR